LGKAFFLVAPLPGGQAPPPQLPGLQAAAQPLPRTPLPVYLRLFRLRAADGCAKALQALSGIPTPKATEALIELASHKDAAFALEAVRTLNSRLKPAAPSQECGAFRWNGWARKKTCQT
jgi:hypothetical protein